MVHRHNTALAGVLALLLVCSGCSDDDKVRAQPASDAAFDTDGDAALDGSQDAQRDGDAGDGGFEDGDSADTADVEEPPKPLLPEFGYYRHDLGCGGSSCIFGVAVNTIAGRIEETRYGNPRWDDLTEVEIRLLEDFAVTEQTHQKMVDGWSCGADESVDGVQWKFDGRALVADKYEHAVHNISGCVPEASDEDDASHVHELIDILDAIRDDHFR